VLLGLELLLEGLLHHFKELAVLVECDALQRLDEVL
jgi:hypothetical protein